MKKILKFIKGCFIIGIASFVLLFVLVVIFEMDEDGSPKDTPSPTATPEWIFDYKVKVGDKVELGSYPYLSQNPESSEKITWIVMERNDDKAILISEKVIEYLPFDENGGDNWGDSSLRWWLNGEFYENTFTEKEKKYIISTLHDNNGDNFEDKLYLIPYDKAYDFFTQGRSYKKGDNRTRYLVPEGTDYLCKETSYICWKRIERYGHYGVTDYSDKSTYSDWWVMPSKTSIYSDRTLIYNNISKITGEPDKMEYDSRCGVRPVMTIKELPKE